MTTEFHSLSRAELQAAAKKHGVKANGTSADIIRRLKEEVGSTPAAAAASSSSSSSKKATSTTGKKRKGKANEDEDEKKDEEEDESAMKDDDKSAAAEEKDEDKKPAKQSAKKKPKKGDDNETPAAATSSSSLQYSYPQPIEVDLEHTLPPQPQLLPIPDGFPDHLRPFIGYWHRVTPFTMSEIMIQPNFTIYMRVLELKFSRLTYKLTTLTPGLWEEQPIDKKDRFWGMLLESATEGPIGLHRELKSRKGHSGCIRTNKPDHLIYQQNMGPQWTPEVNTLPMQFVLFSDHLIQTQPVALFLEWKRGPVPPEALPIPKQEDKPKQ